MITRTALLKTLSATTLALSASQSLALEVPMHPTSPVAPQLTQASLWSFQDRAFRLDSLSVNVPGFRGECSSSQMSGAVTRGPDEKLSSGDFFPITAPEFCGPMNFNFIRVVPQNITSTNELEVTLGTTEYAGGRDFAKWQARDATLTSSVELTARCVNRREEGAFWSSTDYLDCKLPDGQGVLTFKIL